MEVSESILREIVREELSALLAVRFEGAAPRRVRASSPWQPWMPVFLRALFESHGDVLQASAAVAPARSTIYAWRDRCPPYAAAWDSIVVMRNLPSRPAWDELKEQILPPTVREWPDTARREEAS